MSNIRGLPGVLAMIGLLTASFASAAPHASKARILRVFPETGQATGENRFATLSAALSQVAEMRRRGNHEMIIVELEPGTHRLVRPVRIGPEHSGTADRPLVIRGAPDGTSRLTGSQRLQPATLPEGVRAQLPEAARGKVRAYRLPEALQSEPQFRQPNTLNGPTPLVSEVFDRDGALRPARWPNEGYAPVALVHQSVSPSIRFMALPQSRWSNEPDLWTEGFLQWDWLLETIPVASVGLGDRPLELAIRPYPGERSEGRGAVLHALSELDEAGEWWRDRQRGLLIAWPREGETDLEASVADTLLAMEGARHVKLEHLRMERSRRDLVVVQGGENIVIRNSELSWSAGRAAVFEGVAGGGIDGCAIHDIGAIAVRLAGGDRVNLLPGGLFLRDSRLTRFARLAQTQNPAVQIDGVGAQVVGNYIHDAVGYAVHLRGNDHLFGRNEVARLLRGVSDTGAVYAGRDWTALGSSIRENFFHDITPMPGFEIKGVYLDDMASGFSVSRNVFIKVGKPTFVGGGSNNNISENVFVEASPFVSLDSRGETWMADAVMDPRSEIRAAFAAVPVGSERWRQRYPGLAGLLSDEPKVARNNHIVDNLLVNSQGPFFEGKGNARLQTILFNRSISLPELALAPGSELDTLARQLTDRQVTLRWDLTKMRRDTLPESPFRTAVP